MPVALAVQTDEVSHDPLSTNARVRHTRGIYSRTAGVIRVLPWRPCYGVGAVLSICRTQHREEKTCITQLSRQERHVVKKFTFTNDVSRTQYIRDDEDQSAYDADPSVS